MVEYVKESQGGFESALGLFSTGQWLSIPFILIGLYLVFTAEKPVSYIIEFYMFLNKTEASQNCEAFIFYLFKEK